VDRAKLGWATNAAAGGARAWSSLGTVAGNGQLSPATAADQQRDQGQLRSPLWQGMGRSLL
jgi:hypothetical protein